MGFFFVGAAGDALHGHFDRDRTPVLSIAAGDTVRFDTLDAWWSAGPYQGGDPAQRERVAEYRCEYGHALTGSVAVRGATTGSTLAIRVDSVSPASWGTTVAGGRPTAFNESYGIDQELAVLTWRLDSQAMTGRNQFGHTVALHPFMGVMGVAPAEAGRHSTTPPRRTGGNLDCKELVAGSTPYLPVAVDSALFSVGDGHAAQGDGEVGGTAIECPMTVELSFEVRDDLPTDTPIAQTPSGWVTMGVADTLDGATTIALNAMYDLLQHRYGLLPCGRGRTGQRRRRHPRHPDRQPGCRGARRLAAQCADLSDACGANSVSSRFAGRTSAARLGRSRATLNT